MFYLSWTWKGGSSCLISCVRQKRFGSDKGVGSQGGSLLKAYIFCLSLKRSDSKTCLFSEPFSSEATIFSFGETH